MTKTLRPLARLATVTLGIGVAVVLTPLPSYAATCTWGSHCYALTEYGASLGGYAPTNGTSIDLEADCLTVSNANTDFIDWEVWNDTNDDMGQGNYWVEAGMTAGTVVDGNGTHVGFQWFWADNRPNGGGYNEHYVGGASTHIYTNVSIYWQGNANWDVYINNSYVGTSADNGANGWGGNAGMESTTTSARIRASLNNYQYADPNWNWIGVNPNLQFYGSSGWVNGSTQAGSSIGAWTTVSNGCPRTAAAQLDAAGRFSGSPMTASSAGSSLRTLATRVSADNGEKNPRGLSYLLTTRKQAAALMNTSVASDGPAYVVTLQGSFTGAHAHVPAGHARPTGGNMTVVVDANTGQITDMGITDAAPALSRVGTPTAL
jgi:hypothetical protein